MKKVILWSVISSLVTATGLYLIFIRPTNTTADNATTGAVTNAAPPEDTNAVIGRHIFHSYEKTYDSFKAVLPKNLFFLHLDSNKICFEGGYQFYSRHHRKDKRNSDRDFTQLAGVDVDEITADIWRIAQELQETGFDTLNIKMTFCGVNKYGQNNDKSLLLDIGGLDEIRKYASAEYFCRSYIAQTIKDSIDNGCSQLNLWLELDGI